MIDLRHGDMRDVLPTLEAESVHSCVTDPPYHLIASGLRLNNMASKVGTQSYERGFMGAKWDGGSIAFDPDTWRAVHRVLKPGGYMLAFGGTRTQHRLITAIEDAGFEIRDVIAWIYGSGFPKSLDISKAMDRAAGAERKLLDVRPKNYADTPSGYSSTSGKGGVRDGGIWQASSGEIANGRVVTAPATDAARQWNGWGTALKPAMELICVARKPLSERTVAANVLVHGTGAINVDATRIPTTDGYTENAVTQGINTAQTSYAPAVARRTFEPASLGRWPANLCHDGSPEVEAAFAAFGTSESSAQPRNNGEFKSVAKGYEYAHTTHGHADAGTSSRFFKKCSYNQAEWNAYINASGAVETFDPRSEQFVSALTHAVARSTPPWALLPQSYQGQDTSVSDSELRTICASVIALIQNIVGKCSQEWPHGKLSLSNDPVFCVARQGRTGITRITISLWKSGGYVEAATFSITETNSEAGAKGLAGSRLFYSAKATASDRADSRHPTVKPIDLIRWLTRLVTPPGGTVLDPFAGSGTTGEAAMLEGFDAILIEREAEHAADIAHRQRRWHGGDLPLFAEAAD